MGKGSKTLLAIESTLVVPVSAFISMYAAIIDAETAGHGGGSWGWGYLIAVPGGLVLGFILSSASLIALKQKGKLTFLSVFLSAFAVACAVFMISFVFHGVLDFVSQAQSRLDA